MKVDELVKELRLRATHVPERQQFASHAMSHAADWLEAYADALRACQSAACAIWCGRPGPCDCPDCELLAKERKALARLAELEGK